MKCLAMSGTRNATWLHAPDCRANTYAAPTWVFPLLSLGVTLTVLLRVSSPTAPTTTVFRVDVDLGDLCRRTITLELCEGLARVSLAYRENPRIAAHRDLACLSVVPG